MSYLDDIAEKRRVQAEAKKAEGLHSQNIEAIYSSGKEMATATEKLAKPEDIDAILKQLKDLQLTQLLEAQAAKIPKPEKPTIILTDQTDLGDRLTKLADNISTSVSNLNSTRLDSQQLETLKDLKVSLDNYTKSVLNADTANQKASKALLAAVKAIEVAPVVTMPDPKVTIKEAKIDFTPLQDTIRESMTPLEEKLDLSCYKAQDINDSGKLQYVGFVNPTGQWYIIENDTQKNKLRYVFGNNDYAEAFQKAPTYEYSLLDEAVNALSA